MSEVIAVLGAGSGLGASVARRFGKSGYRVALVARRSEQVEALAAELAGEGIDATAFTADFSDPSQAQPLIAEIIERLGRLDVIEYAPISMQMPFTPAKAVDAAVLREPLDFYLLTLVELVQAALPGMLERKSGAILAASGPSAVKAVPGMSGHGPAMAGARNYLHTLAAEVADDGVRVGTLVVNAIVDGSAAHAMYTSPDMGLDAETIAALPLVDPDDLAEALWELATGSGDLDMTVPA